MSIFERLWNLDSGMGQVKTVSIPSLAGIDGIPPFVFQSSQFNIRTL